MSDEPAAHLTKRLKKEVRHAKTMSDVIRAYAPEGNKSHIATAFAAQGAFLISASGPLDSKGRFFAKLLVTQPIAERAILAHRLRTHCHRCILTPHLSVYMRPGHTEEHAIDKDKRRGEVLHIDPHTSFAMGPQKHASHTVTVYPSSAHRVGKEEWDRTQELIQRVTHASPDAMVDMKRRYSLLYVVGDAKGSTYLSATLDAISIEEGLEYERDIAGLAAAAYGELRPTHRNTNRNEMITIAGNNSRHVRYVPEVARRTFQETDYVGEASYIYPFLYWMGKQFPDRFCVPTNELSVAHAMRIEPSRRMIITTKKPSYMDRIINRCWHKRFCGWVVIFQSSDMHGNAMLLDRSTMEVTRYEPRGYDQEGEYDADTVDEMLTGWCRNILGAKYIRPRDYQAALGPQDLEIWEALGDDKRLPKLGPCTIWSLMFIYQRVCHPAWDNETVARKIRSHPAPMIHLIQAFGHWAVEKIKEVRGEMVPGNLEQHTPPLDIAYV